MKYLAIVSGAFWLITLGAFLWARLRSSAEEPILAILVILISGALAIISTVVLAIIAIAKWIGA